jgi:hypothetical protein
VLLLRSATYSIAPLAAGTTEQPASQERVAAHSQQLVLATGNFLFTGLTPPDYRSFTDYRGALLRRGDAQFLSRLSARFL